MKKERKKDSSKQAHESQFVASRVGTARERGGIAEEATHSPVGRLGTIRRGEYAGVILLEVLTHSRGTAVTRHERFVAVDARGLFGSRVVRSLDEVGPDYASGLAAIDAIVRQDLLEVFRRKRGRRRRRRRRRTRRNGRGRRSGGSARTGSWLGR